MSLGSTEVRSPKGGRVKLFRKILIGFVVLVAMFIFANILGMLFAALMYL